MMVEVETMAIAKKIHELLAIAEAAALETAARVVEEDYKRSPGFFDCQSTTSRIRALQPGSLLKDFENHVREDQRRRSVPISPASPRPSNAARPSKNDRPHNNWYSKTIAWLQGSIG